MSVPASDSVDSAASHQSDMWGALVDDLPRGPPARWLFKGHSGWEFPAHASDEYNFRSTRRQSSLL